MLGWHEELVLHCDSKVEPAGQIAHHCEIDDVDSKGGSVGGKSPDVYPREIDESDYPQAHQNSLV